MSVPPILGGRVAKLAGIGTLALAAMAFNTASAQAEEWTKSYTVSGRAHVRVDSNDGAVRVTTGDSKQIELRVTYNGYKLDFSLSSCLTGYIQRNFTPIGGNQWKSAAGNIYFLESNHWDVTYFNCGGC